MFVMPVKKYANKVVHHSPGCKSDDAYHELIANRKAEGQFHSFKSNVIQFNNKHFNAKRSVRKCGSFVGSQKVISL